MSPMWTRPTSARWLRVRRLFPNRRTSPTAIVAPVYATARATSGGSARTSKVDLPRLLLTSALLGPVGTVGNLARAEDRLSHAHDGRAFLDRELVVAGHTH